MKLSEYPPEQIREWLDLPATRAFVEDIEDLIIHIRSCYRTFTPGDMTIWKQQGKEFGIEMVKELIHSLGEG
jgi:hypothetical protein